MKTTNNKRIRYIFSEHKGSFWSNFLSFLSLLLKADQVTFPLLQKGCAIKSRSQDRISIAP